MAVTLKAQWEYIYQTVPQNEIPWENGAPSFDLVSLCQEIPNIKQTKVLDIGCGLGTQTLYLAQQKAKVTGLDISETAIMLAQEKVLQHNQFATFVVGDVAKMPLPNSLFDIVYDRGCYHHLSLRQRKSYLKEVRRVLRKNGLLHLFIFSGAITSVEVIEQFLPYFSVKKAYDGVITDHTIQQNVSVQILEFIKS